MVRLLSFFAVRSRKALFFTAAVLTLLASPAPVSAESAVFPVPEIIRHNVAFWIRIYTEVSLKEGLLHDRDFPQIVYEKSPTGDRTGKARSEFISGRMKIYSDAIVAVRDSAPEKWGTVEKRVAEMFKKAPAGAMDEAETRIRHQTGQRERFRLGVERSGVYLDTISAILKMYGVPDELKYLPHVESSFDATAYSRVGASGLWQFMRATGRGYMRIDYNIDERSDPIISSHAAARFLRANYDMLKTWPLAITGYNSGPNGMRRAVDNLGTRDIGTILEKHESASFKFASRNFYACFLAVLEIMEKPDKYLKGVKPRPKWQATAINLPFAMAPNQLCKALDINEQAFKRLNPSFRPVVFKEQRQMPSGYAVNLPHTVNGEEALNTLKRTTPPPQRAVAARQAEREANDGYYKVVSGDNLNSIARRLGVPMAELAEINNITNSSRIYVGQVLRVPSGSAPPRAVASRQPAAAVSTTTPTVAKDTVIKAVDTVAVSTPTAAKDTVVKAVDTVAISTPTVAKDTVIKAVDTVAVSTPTTAKDTVIKAIDTVAVSTPTVAKDTVIKAIDTVAASTPAADTLSAIASVVAEVVPASTGPSGKPSTDTRFDANVYDLGMTVAAGGASVRIRVSVDETIGHLASWMRVSADEIRQMNNMGPGEALTPGRVINIPISGTTNIKRFEVNRLQYHMAIEEDFFARYNIADLERYKVRPGDNLWRICRDAKIPMWLLKKYNRGRHFYNLQPGGTLWIPRIAAKAGTVEGGNEFDPAVTESEEAE